MLSKYLLSLLLLLPFVQGLGANTYGLGDSSTIYIADGIPDEIIRGDYGYIFYETVFYVDVRVFVNRKEDTTLRKERIKVNEYGDFVRFSFQLPNALFPSGNKIQTQFIYHPQFNLNYKADMSERLKEIPSHIKYMEGQAAAPPVYKAIKFKKERLKVSRLTIETIPAADSVYLFHVFDWEVFVKDNDDVIGNLRRGSSNKLMLAHKEIYVTKTPYVDYSYVIVGIKDGKLTTYPCCTNLGDVDVKAEIPLQE